MRSATGGVAHVMDLVASGIRLMKTECSRGVCLCVRVDPFYNEMLNYVSTAQQSARSGIERNPSKARSILQIIVRVLIPGVWPCAVYEE